jgi:putative acetyltransferase
MNILIRKITKADNQLLADIIRNVFIEHNAPEEGTVFSDPTTDKLFEFFKEPKSVLWVAELDHTVVGSCGVYPTKGLNENCAELVKFYIFKEARDKGIGKELFQRSIQSARDLGYTQLYLECLPHFKKAINMYEKAGFVKLNKPLGESTHTTCNIWMLLDLK